MALYHKWGVKTGLTFALQFFMLISDGIGVMPLGFQIRVGKQQYGGHNLMHITNHCVLTSFGSFILFHLIKACQSMEKYK